MPRLPQIVRRILRRRQRSPDPQAVRLLPIGRALAITLAVAITATGLLLLGALAWLGLPSTTGQKPTVAEFLDTLKIVLAVVGGIGGVVALVVAYRKQRITEEENHRARETARREDTKLYVDRFDKASSRLGDASAAVRLAAVHALAALADDWEGGRQMCIDVLCAYLRMPPEPEPDRETDPGAHTAWRAMSEVRSTIWRLISVHLQADAAIPWRGADLDFTRVIITSDIDFTHAVFSDGTVRFDEAEFAGGSVRFSDAKFSSGRVSFDKARFTGGKVFFDDAWLSGSSVSFSGAKISDGMLLFNRTTFCGGLIWFDQAEFSGGSVGFDDAQFSGGWTIFDASEFSNSMVRFSRTKFTGGEVRFFLSHFSGGRLGFASSEFSGGLVSFKKAKFSGGKVEFEDAKFTGGKVEFDEAEISGGEMDFSRVAHWTCPPTGLPDETDTLQLPPRPAGDPAGKSLEAAAGQAEGVHPDMEPEVDATRPSAGNL